MDEALYLILKHRRDPKQKWQNDWLDDDRIKSITTTHGVAKQCALQGKNVLFVHRCAVKLEGESNIPPTISCSVHVERIEELSSNSIIHFENAQSQGFRARTKQRLQGRKYYYDVSP